MRISPDPPLATCYSYFKMISVLPRQARNKHRESTQKQRLLSQVCLRSLDPLGASLRALRVCVSGVAAVAAAGSDPGSRQC
jgi:hypothetical protein